MLLWLANHPSLFVATTLVGNNVANYIVSTAIVGWTEHVFPNPSIWIEFLALLVITPFVFIYGELLPKNLFFQSPNYLIRKISPAFIAITILMLPITAILWGLSQILNLFVGETPHRIQFALARKELREVFDEGHAAGILRPVQRHMALELISIAQQPAVKIATPLHEAPIVDRRMPIEVILQQATEADVSYLLVEDKPDSREILGYVKVSDLVLQREFSPGNIRPLAKIRAQQPHIAAMMQMRSSDADMALVIDASGNPVGTITTDKLSAPILNRAI